MRIVLPTIVLTLLSTAVALVAGDAPSTPPPPGMRWIDGGAFVMGTDDARSMPNERPARRVEIAGFWIDEHAVTNAEFREFVEATKYVTTAEKPVDWEELKKQARPGTPRPAEELLKPGAIVFTPPDHPVDVRDMRGWWTWTAGASWKHPRGPASSIDGKDSFPVVQLSWDDAAAYAKWADKRLPTEAEWEYAARGGRVGTRYDWGNELQVDGRFMCNTFTGDFPWKNTAADGFAGAAPVKSFPANGYGLFDMAGNVWNWTADAYRESPQAPPDPFRRVTKGGSFLCNPAYCDSSRPTARRGTPYDTGFEHIGFRCAKSPGRGRP